MDEHTPIDPRKLPAVYVPPINNNFHRRALRMQADLRNWFWKGLFGGIERGKKETR